MKSVLFVCTANICRSPLAMGLLMEKVNSLDETDWLIESAGVWANTGDTISSNVDLLMRNKGIDLSAHQSRPVAMEILEKFNLILTMENGQKEGLKVAFPDIAKRVYLISEMVDHSHSIRDPYGRSLADFKSTAKELQKIIDGGFDRIRQLASD